MDFSLRTNTRRIARLSALFALMTSHTALAVEALQLDTMRLPVPPVELQTVEPQWPRSGLHDGMPRWSAAIDNDLFGPTNEDRDYTGGFALTVANHEAPPIAALNRKLHSWLDRRIGLDRLMNGSFEAVDEQWAAEVGVRLFTPDDIEATYAISDDRPYSNLVYLSSARQRLDRYRTTLWQSTVTLGLLGTSVGESLQTAIHRRTGTSAPMGYDYQISDGGELTGRFAVARHRLAASGATRRLSWDASYSIEAGIGYLTDASVGLNVRVGRVTSPWWTAVGKNADYTGQAAPVAARSMYRGSQDAYVFAGFRLRARVYNALLQGQFRDSEVTFRSADLNRALAEAWIGMTVEADQWRVNYVIRHQTAELRRGVGSRALTWAGIEIGRRTL